MVECYAMCWRADQTVTRQILVDSCTQGIVLDHADLYGNVSVRHVRPGLCFFLGIRRSISGSVLGRSVSTELRCFRELGFGAST